MTTITRFEHPKTLDSAEMWVLRAEERLWAPVLLDRVGGLDMLETPELLWFQGAKPLYNRQIHLVVSDSDAPSGPEDVLALATVDLPMSDNVHLAWLWMVVSEDQRRRGLGTLLLDECLRLASEHGRTELHTSTWEPGQLPAPVEELVPVTGTGRIPAHSAHARFLLGNRFRLSQVERVSRVELPPADVRVEAAARARAVSPPEYEVLIVAGGTPEELLGDAAFLREEMSVDVPTGDVQFERETWSADRVRISDAGLAHIGREQLQAFVRHTPSGRLVGFTRLFRNLGKPTVGHQWETLVVRHHRGHRLGMLIKTANHAALSTHWPETSTLITGNAEENQYMLAINVALGYRPYAASGYWTKSLRGSD